MVFSTWYNEEKLAHFFLRHYLYADRVIINLDADTNDGTLDIINQYHNARYRKFSFPEHGVDEDYKAALANDTYKTYGSNYDWVINVDADEFVMPPAGEHPYSFLQRQAMCEVVSADMFQAYRHETESELDYNRADIIGQRRHGTREFIINGEDRGSLYNKPIIVRSGMQLIWGPGNHSLEIINSRYVDAMSKESFTGSHWAMADESIAIDRRVYGRKNRQSDNNLKKQYNVHQYNVTEESIREECRAHSRDPIML